MRKNKLGYISKEEIDMNNFKKTIAALTAITTIATSAMSIAGTTLSVSAATTSLGDINEDGAVDYKDAALNLKYYAAALSNKKSGDESLFASCKDLGMTDEKIKAMDVNGDGRIDSRDSIAIIEYSAAKSLGYLKVLTSENLTEIEELYKSDAFNKYCQFVCDAMYRCVVNTDDINNFKVFEFSEVKMGDANGDGVVDSKDAVSTLNTYALSLTKNSSVKNMEDENEAKEFNADINCDGVIDSKDAVEILQTYAENLANNR